jgi:hypothetical protein
MNATAYCQGKKKVTTAKAVLVLFYVAYGEDISLEERQFWIPLSQITLHPLDQDAAEDDIWFDCPVWLLEKNNLFAPE